MIFQFLQVALLSTAFGLTAKNTVVNENGYTYIYFDEQLSIDYTGVVNPIYYNNVKLEGNIRDDYAFNFDMSFKNNNVNGITLDSDFYGTRTCDIYSWGRTNVTFKIDIHCYAYDGDGYDIIDFYYSPQLTDGTYDEGILFYSYVSTNTTFFENSSTDNWYYFYLPMDLINNYFGGSYQQGYSDGFSDGEAEGYPQGYSEGYVDAYNIYSNQDTVATAIFVGIIDVALLPINFFLACLNFEVFGINIGSMVTALLTILVVIIIVRVIFSGGNKK